MEIRELLALAVERGASDLHLSAGLPPALRVNGAVTPVDALPLTDEAIRTLLGQIMTASQWQQYEQTRDLDFACSAAGIGRFRVNAFCQLRGAAAVLRVVPTRVRSLAEIGAPLAMASLAQLPRGLVLVTGPTGSGKSTTLAALLQTINSSRPAHIVTIEDPIEFIHHPDRSLINQREVGAHTGSFATALRAALREDPDVLLVGELRDLETIRLALTAAETGHLVLATLHTVGAAQAVDRMVDVFPDGERSMVRTMLADCIRAIVSQELLPRADGSGRVAAHEVLLSTPAVRNLIREHKLAQLATVMQTSQALGMQTLDQSLQALVAVGAISAATARGTSDRGEQLQV